MSDNGKGTGKKDSFAKPGDESIVSGKSFFLSFGKKPMGSGNPLLESEKHKNGRNAKGDVNIGGKKQPMNGGKSDRPDRENDSHVKKADGNGQQGESRQDFKKGGKRRHDKHRKGGAREQAIQQSDVKGAKQEAQYGAKLDAFREKGKGHDKKGHVKDVRPHQESTDNAHQAENLAVKPKESDVREERHDKGAHGNRNDRFSTKPGGKNVDKRDKSRGDKGHKGSQKPQAEPREASHPTSEAQLQQGQRPKHKKERFVPTSPSTPVTDESLLQPIVNTTGIISGGRGASLRGSRKSKFGVGAFTGEVDDSKVYFDRSKPLAEQIAEREKPKQYNSEPSSDVPTVEVIGVRFREAGKVYYFAPGNNKVEKGEAVIVETMRGSSAVVEYGFCAIGNRNVAESEIVAPLKPIVRKATEADTERYLANKQLEESAAKIFKEKVSMLKLEMSLVYVEYTFDNSKLLFYFTADGRVDFRELIKELASAFKTRIELRQIGVRDEAKAVGGLGVCGRPICCKTFLGEFSQVSIKMAKDQNLILNSSKISGTCGRFMCCIRYEDEVYQKEYEKTPKLDAIVETPDGKGVVVESFALKGIVKVLLDDQPESVPKPYNSSEIKILGYAKRNNSPNDDEELPEEL